MTEADFAWLDDEGPAILAKEGVPAFAAEELLQDVKVQYWMKYRNETHSNLRGLWYRMVVNCGRTWQRSMRQAARVELFVDDAVAHAGDDPADGQLVVHPDVAARVCRHVLALLPGADTSEVGRGLVGNDGALSEGSKHKVRSYRHRFVGRAKGVLTHADLGLLVFLEMAAVADTGELPPSASKDVQLIEPIVGTYLSFIEALTQPSKPLEDRYPPRLCRGLLDGVEDPSVQEIPNLIAGLSGENKVYWSAIPPLLHALDSLNRDGADAKSEWRNTIEAYDRLLSGFWHYWETDFRLAFLAFLPTIDVFHLAEFAFSPLHDISGEQSRAVWSKFYGMCRRDARLGATAMVRSLNMQYYNWRDHTSLVGYLRCCRKMDLKFFGIEPTASQLAECAKGILRTGTIDRRHLRMVTPSE